MRRGPQQIDIAGAEQVLQHRNAGITGREVRVVGEGDRQRTWGDLGKAHSNSGHWKQRGKEYPAGN